jgi:ABC-type sugar transport system permease subunit
MSENEPSTSTTPPEAEVAPAPKLTPQDRTRIWIMAAIGVIVLALVIGLAVLLVNQPVETTGHIRDIFIIFMALESLVIGIALVILIIQLAILINLIQNEVKPILQSTNETVSTLRGTAAFLSNNLVEPVITLNEYLAAIRKFFDLIRGPRR